jgi:hypothetical protein
MRGIAGLMLARYGVDRKWSGLLGIQRPLEALGVFNRFGGFGGIQQVWRLWGYSTGLEALGVL